MRPCYSEPRDSKRPQMPAYRVTVFLNIIPCQSRKAVGIEFDKCYLFEAQMVCMIIGD